MTFYCRFTICCLIFWSTEANLANLPINIDPTHLHNLKFSSDPFNVSLVKNPLTEVVWPENFEAKTVYCVGSPHFRQLSFECRDCSLDQTEKLASWTSDISDMIGFPGIKLSGVLVDNPGQWNSKRLVCSAVDKNGQGVVVAIPITVQYYRNPEIKTVSGDRPLMNEKGLKTLYYAKNGDELRLACSADCWPPARRFSWYNGNRKLEVETDIVDLNEQFVGFVLTCEADNFKTTPKKSVPVFIESAEKPLHVGDNFHFVRNSNLNRNVHVGDKLKLECSFSAYPESTISWFFEDYRNTISPVKCGKDSSAKHAISKSEELNVITTNSTCVVEFETFNQTGDYWCTGCIQVAENVTLCDLPTNEVSQNRIFFNVTGAPIRSTLMTRVEKLSDPDAVRIKEPFCSNPQVGPSSVSLTCGEEKYFLMDKKLGISFEELTTIPEKPFCLEATFLFSTPNELIKQSTHCKIMIENPLGTLEYTLPVGTYFDVDQTEIPPQESPHDSKAEKENRGVFLTLILPLALFIAAVLVVLAVLWSKGLDENADQVQIH
uniref:Ig-like domain-containing protein n=1 Tax=Romanomermis culicivorax TaxID=13658 RepID=A0A915JGD6_ROMCU